jgi:hypothetical protein
MNFVKNQYAIGVKTGNSGFVKTYTVLSDIGKVFLLVPNKAYFAHIYTL